MPTLAVQSEHMMGQGGTVEAAREEEMETCVKVLIMI
jgi:hypothetical protein